MYIVYLSQNLIFFGQQFSLRSLYSSLNNNDDIICLGVNVFFFQVTVLFIALILLLNSEDEISVVLIETINGLNK